MEGTGSLFKMGGVAYTLRSKENYLIIFGQKLSELPWGSDGAQKWFDAPHKKLNGKSPSEMVATNSGIEVEPLIDELECLAAGVKSLEALQVQYSEHPEFEGVWLALEQMRSKLPW